VKRGVIALFTAFAVVLAAAPASAQIAEPESTAMEDQLEQLNAAALERFQAKDYDGAAEIFKQAYELSPEPNYLFNIGRVYEEKGDFPNAISYYDQFVRQPGVELESRELAVERLRVLRQIQEELEPRAPTPEPIEPDVDDVEPEPTEDEPPSSRPPRMRVAGYALLGVGGAVLVGGAAFGGAAVARRNELEDLDGFEMRTDAVDRGKRNALVADILFIAGGTLALTGLVLTLVSLRKKDGGASRRARVSPSAGPLGASVDVRVSF
jgi:tetratricopeptide (TPR) repeat protein